VESFCERSQSDQPADRDEGKPRGPGESPDRIAEDSGGKAVWEQGQDGRSARHDEKGVRIALGQQLERTPPDLGADENELGVQLPGLNLDDGGVHGS
jgi:hypothetical protein